MADDIVDPNSIEALKRKFGESQVPRRSIPLQQRIQEAKAAGENFYAREDRLTPSWRAATTDVSLIDRAKLTFEAGFRQTLLGAAEAYLYPGRPEDVNFQNAAEVTDYLRGIGIRERQQQWEQATPPRTTLEHTVNIGSFLAGSLASPEIMFGPTTKFVQGGATAGARIFRAAATGGVINTFIDPIVQAMRIDAGLQETYEPTQTALSAAIGVALPGVLQGGAELVRAATGAVPPSVGAPKPPRVTDLQAQAIKEFDLQRIPPEQVNPDQERAFIDFAQRLRDRVPTEPADLRNAVDGGFLDHNGQLTPRGARSLLGREPTARVPEPDYAPEIRDALPDPTETAAAREQVDAEVERLIREISDSTGPEELSPEARQVVSNAFPDGRIDLTTGADTAMEQLRTAARDIVTGRPQEVAPPATQRTFDAGQPIYRVLTGMDSVDSLPPEARRIWDALPKEEVDAAIEILKKVRRLNEPGVEITAAEVSRYQSLLNKIYDLSSGNVAPVTPQGGTSLLDVISELNGVLNDRLSIDNMSPAAREVWDSLPKADIEAAFQYINYQRGLSDAGDLLDQGAIDALPKPTFDQAAYRGFITRMNAAAKDAVDRINAPATRPVPEAIPTAPVDLPPTPGQRAGVFMFNPADLQIDAKTFQFKTGGDAQGVTPLLRDVTQWNPDAAGQIIVWERADGTRFVADGHQRVSLAKRLMSSGATLGNTFLPRVRLNPSATAELENQLTELVRGIAGRDISVGFADTLPAGDVTAFRAAGSETAGGTVNLFSNGEALVRVALKDPKYDPANSALHEAFHIVESNLLTDDEYARLTAPAAMERVRELAQAATGQTLDGVPDYELRAIAFAHYVENKRSVSADDGIIKRAFDKLQKVLTAVRDLLRKRGYRDAEKIFDTAFAGGFVDRIPNPSRLELQGIAPHSVGGPRIRNPIKTWHGTGRQWAPERLVRFADGTTDFIVGKPGQMPTVPEGATVLQDFPFGRSRISENLRTGEGSQAYSEGLYTAEVRDVADTVYRPIAGGRAGDRGWMLPSYIEDMTALDVIYAARRRAENVYGPGSIRVGDATRSILNEREFSKTLIQRSTWSSATDESIAKINNLVREALDYLKKNNVPDWPKPGRLYEFALHARQDQFLDWFSPVDQQPTAVRKALDDAGIDTGHGYKIVGEIDEEPLVLRAATMAASRGEDPIEFVTASYNARKQEVISDAAVSEGMFSEAVGDWLARYDEILGWIRKNEDAIRYRATNPSVSFTGEQAYRELDRIEHAKGSSAEQYLYDRGIVGTRHLDRFSRYGDGATYNYVVSPQAADIVEVLSVGNTIPSREAGMQIPGSLYREVDGFSAEDVMAIAALKNIREGSGSVIDAAKFLRLRPGEAQQIGEISRTATRQAVAMTNLSPDVWGMTINGVIDPSEAAVIGRLIPDDPALQGAAADAVVKMRPASEMETQVLVRRVKQADLVDTASGTQTDMFGDLTPQSSVAEEVRIVARAIRTLTSDKNLLGRVAKNAQQIESVGDSRIDRAAAQQGAQASAQLAEIVEKAAFVHGDIRESLKRLAVDVANGERSLADAVDAFLVDLRGSERLSDTGPGMPDLADRTGAAAKPQGEMVFAMDVEAAQHAPMPQTLEMRVSEKPSVRIDNPMYLSHGSGQLFETFDTRFFGTGEGTQWQGVGFYFTDHRPTAFNYSGLGTRRGGYIYDAQVHARPEDFLDGSTQLRDLTPDQRQMLGIRDDDPVLLASQESKARSRSIYSVIDYLKNNPGIEYRASDQGMVGIKWTEPRGGGQTTNYVIFPGQEGRIQIVRRIDRPPVLAVKAAESDNPIVNEIRAAYAEVASRPSDHAFIHEIRPMLSGTRDEQDAAFKALLTGQEATFDPWPRLTAAQKAEGVRIGATDMNTLAFEKDVIGWPDDFLNRVPEVSPAQTPDELLNQYVRELKAAQGSDAYDAILAKLETDANIKKADAILIARRVTDAAPDSKKAAIEALRGSTESPGTPNTTRLKVLREAGATAHILDAMTVYDDALRVLSRISTRGDEAYTAADLEWIRAIQATLADGQAQTQRLMGKRTGLKGAFQQARGSRGGSEPAFYNALEDTSLPRPSAGLVARLSKDDVTALGKLYDALDTDAITRARAAVEDLYTRMDGQPGAESRAALEDALYADIDAANRFRDAQGLIDTLTGSTEGRFYAPRRERLDAPVDPKELLTIRILNGEIPTRDEMTALGANPDRIDQASIDSVATTFQLPDDLARRVATNANDPTQFVVNAAAVSRKNGLLANSTLEYSQALRGRPLRGEVGRPAGGVSAGTGTNANMRLSEISTRVAKAIGMTVRQGKVKGGRRVQGTFDRTTGVTRIRAVDAFEILVHEGGHTLHLDPRNAADVNRIIGNNATEVEALSYPEAVQTGNQALIRAEGMAEWFRLWMTNPNYARRAAPIFTADMENWLRTARPTMWQALFEARQGYVDWLNQGSTDLVVSDIVSSSKPPFFPRAIGKVVNPDMLPTGQTLYSFFDRFYTWSVDRFHPVHRAVKALLDLNHQNTGNLIDLPAMKNPYKLLRNSIRAFQTGDAWLRYGIIPRGSITPEGPSVAAAMELAVGKNWYGKWRTDDMVNFGAYLVSRRMVREYERFLAGEIPNPPGKGTLGDYRLAVAELEAANPNFMQAAQMIYEWNANLLRLKNDAGILPGGQESFDRLIMKPDYVPLQRDFSDTVENFASRLSQADATNRQAIMREFRGSLRSVVNPIEAMIADAYRTSARIAFNDVVNALADLGKTAGHGGGAIIEEVPTSRLVPYKVDAIEALKRAGKDAGVNQDNLADLIESATELLDGEQMATLFRRQEVQPGAERIIYGWRGGERYAYQLADGQFGRDLFEALTGIGQEQSNWVLAWLATPATVLRGSITTHPAFLVANYFRDQTTAFVLNTKFIPFVSGARGIVDQVRQSEIARLAYQSGVVMGGPETAALDEARIAREITSLQKKGWNIRLEKGIADVAKFFEMSETGTRTELFRQYFEAARGRGMSDLEAMYEASFQASDFMDFGRHGSRMLFLRRMIPFFNAAIQGTDKTARTMISDLRPLAKVFKGEALTGTEARNLSRSGQAWLKLGVLTALSATYALINADDPEWQDAGDYIRSTHWLFKVPGGKWVAVPKPFEMATVLNFGERLAEGIKTQDPTWAEKWVRSWGLTLAPPLEPTGIMVPLEGMVFNYDLFRDQPIVPQYQMGLEPSEQFNSYTSEFSKTLGRAINVSPAKIDFMLVGFTGTWGRDLLGLTNRVVPERQSNELYDWPIAGRFIKNLARGSDATDKFYGLVSQTGGRLQQKWNTYRDRMNGGREAEAAVYYDRMRDDEKAWVALNSLKSPDDKRIHPLRRASDLMTIYRAMRSEILGQNLVSIYTSEKIVTNRTHASMINDAFARLAAIEARNAMIATGEGGWANKEVMDPTPYLNAIRTISPEVYQELQDRIQKKGILPFDGVRAVWPQLKQRLLEGGPEAFVGDLRYEAMSYGSGVTTAPPTTGPVFRP